MINPINTSGQPLADGDTPRHDGECRFEPVDVIVMPPITRRSTPPDRPPREQPIGRQQYPASLTVRIPFWRGDTLPGEGSIAVLWQTDPQTGCMYDLVVYDGQQMLAMEPSELYGFFQQHIERHFVLLHDEDARKVMLRLVREIARGFAA